MLSIRAYGQPPKWRTYCGSLSWPRLPAPRKKLRATNTLVMMADPRGHQSEAFRMLRSNLEFVNLDRGARTILVTSALEQEGKSTTVSNLAIALARAGKRVALVDLDLRRPTIGAFFGIGSLNPGVTNVVLGQVPLEQALVEVFHATAGAGVDYVQLIEIEWERDRDGRGRGRSPRGADARGSFRLTLVSL